MVKKVIALVIWGSLTFQIYPQNTPRDTHNMKSATVKSINTDMINEGGLEINDEWSIEKAYFSNDVGVYWIINPHDGEILEGASLISIKAGVQNYGTNVQSPGIPVKLKIAGPENYLYEDSEMTINSLPGVIGQEWLDFYPYWQVPNTNYTYTIEIWTELVGDENPQNDRKMIQVTALEMPSNDVGISGIAKPRSGEMIKGNTLITVEANAKNYGIDTQSAGIPVKLKITGPENYLYEDTENTSDVIARGETKSVNFEPTWKVPNTNYTYMIEILIMLTGDENPSNDKQSIQISVLKVDSLRVRLVSQEPLAGDCRGISISDTVAIVCDGGGVYAVDISDPTDPQKKDVIDIDTWTYAADVHAVGNYAYVSESWWYEGKGRLNVIDISDPSRLNRPGRSERLGDYARDIYVSGNWAYLALDDGGLYILSITPPNIPGAVTGKYDHQDAIWGVYVKDNYAYITGDDNLYIYDVSAAPIATLLGKCSEFKNGWGVYVAGSYAYVANREDGLRIIDVSDPSNPYLVSTIDTPGYARHVQVVNNLAYVADGFYGVRVIDISNPNAPTEIGYHIIPAGDCLDVEVSGDYFYGSMSGGHGIYVFQFDESIDGITADPSFVMPSDVRLFQNYPNPFNPQTMIEYRLPKDGYVTLKIYNHLGQQVAMLVNQNQKAGHHTIQWNAKEFASGVYIYQLDFDSFSQVRKMLILR